MLLRSAENTLRGAAPLLVENNRAPQARETSQHEENGKTPKPANRARAGALNESPATDLVMFHSTRPRCHRPAAGS